MSVLSRYASAQVHVAPTASSNSDDEAASLLLIASLLAQDVEQERSWQHAQHVQYHLALSDSRPGSPTLPLRPPPASEDEEDHLAALRLALDAVQASISIVTVDGLEELRTRQQADEVAARQLALTFEAAARRERLDAEFARALQKGDDDGRDIDAHAAREVEKVLGEARVRQLMSPPVPQPKLQVHPPVQPQPRPRRNPFPHPAHEFVRAENALLSGAPSDAKGKGKALETPPTVVDSLTTCRICFEPCHLTANPFAAALSATSSNRVQFGMHVGEKAHGHAYCIGCLVAYIQSKIEDTNAAKVFPIACPECTHELTDDLAARVLGPSNLEGWHYRRLLDSMPALFCPNVRCSARVVRDTDGDPQAQCPSCHKSMCCECKTAWHPGYSCAAFQALPPEARDPEDFSILRLADERGWRRCPSCKAVIELESGCYHMTCACGGHFCFVCSGPWNQRTKRCAKNPPCDLWNEANLIVGRDRHAGERRRARDEQHVENERVLPRANLLPPPAAVPVPYNVAAEVRQQQHQRDEAADAARRMRELAQFHAEMREWEREREEDARREEEVEQEEEEQEEEQRRREEEEDQREWARQQAAHYAPPAQARNYAKQHAMERLDWMSHLNGSPHAFTAEFLQGDCGYCQDRFNSIHDLQQHLATTTRHRVFTCCSKFFRVQPHLHQHLDSRSANQHDPFET